jgi:SAM-dependent methyltransferase
MGTSLIYRATAGYELAMRALYGRYYQDRQRAIAELIPTGASVVDLCCGPATLYTRYLRHTGTDYTGVDINERLLANLTRRGGRGLVCDLRGSDPLPRADYVLMHASLYHFLPDPAPIVDRMLAAANRQVIIAEPVRNLSDSNVRILAALGRRMTDPGVGEHASRFTEQTLDHFFAGYAHQVHTRRPIAGGREKLYVLQA